jgi:hypothetical protein
MNRARLEQDLAEAEQCITDGKVYVKSQRAIVTKLTRQGDDTEKARYILKTLQDTLALHIEHRDQLKRQLSAHEPRAKRKKPNEGSP